MLKHLSSGFKMTLWNPFSLFLLFAYQLAWGFILYRFIQSVVVPLMHRYPGSGVHEEWSALFLAESQFQLYKTDIANSYLWLLAAILVVRMVLTPLFNAGIYYNIRQTHIDDKRSFTLGMRKLGLPFFIIYAVQMALTLAPLYWLIPWLRKTVMEQGLMGFELSGLLPCILLYAAYVYLLRLVFMYIQLGIASSMGALYTLIITARHFLFVLLISFTIMIVSVGVTVAGLALSMMWAGLAAVILHQVLQLAKTLFRLWEIGAQHSHFASRTTS